MTSSKTLKIILGIIAIVIIFVGGGFAGKIVFDKDTSNEPGNKNANSSSVNSNSSAPAKTSKLTTLLSKPQDYVGKEVSLKGSVYKIDGHDYYLIEKVKKPTKSKPNSIKLDLSKSNIDVSQYANIGSTSAKKPSKATPTAPKPAVTLTGKISKNKTTKQFVLVVNSLNK